MKWPALLTRRNSKWPGYSDSIGIRAQRRSPKRRGWFVVEGFVRPLEVVLGLEAVELPLLPAKSCRRRPRCPGLQGLVHSLVRTVLLRTAGPDPLMNDAELHPPNVQRAQSVDAGRREWRAVVAADRRRQAMLAEHPLEGGPRSRRLHVEQRAAREQVPAVAIQQGQRIAVDAVASLELALEVDRPHLVRSIGVQRRRTWVPPLLASSPALDQAVAFQDVEDCAAARKFGGRHLLSNQPVKLSCAPAVSLLQEHDQLLDLDRRSMRAATRRATDLLQPVVSVGLVPARPLVSRRSRHTVVLAELAHRPLAGLQLSHEPRPLHQRTRLLPWHPRTCKGCARTRVKDLPRLYQRTAAALMSTWTRTSEASFRNAVQPAVAAVERQTCALARRSAGTATPRAGPAVPGGRDTIGRDLGVRC